MSQESPVKHIVMKWTVFMLNFIFFNKTAIDPIIYIVSGDSQISLNLQ